MTDQKRFIGIDMSKSALRLLVKQEKSEQKNQELYLQTRELYEELNKLFASVGRENWQLEISEWQKLNKETNEGFGLKYNNPYDKTCKFKAIIVSNSLCKEFICISLA